MILSDREMYATLESGAIEIIPMPGEGAFASTAVDLTLDSKILIWDPKPSPGRARPAGHPRRRHADLPARPRRGAGGAQQGIPGAFRHPADLRPRGRREEAAEVGEGLRSPGERRAKAVSVRASHPCSPLPTPAVL